EFFEQEYPHIEFIETAVIKNVFYAACRNRKDPKGTVWAMVCLISRKRSPDEYFNFTYKPMEETEGPYYHDAPERILDILSPTDHEYAVKWRERCRERLAKKKAIKVGVGDKIRFEHPISFTDGFKGQDFELVRYRKRGIIFRSLDNRRFYRVSGWRERS